VITRPVFHTLLAVISLVLFAVPTARAQNASPQGSLLPMRSMPVALHVIARGAVLTADDFEYRDTTTHTSPDTNRIAAGWVTRRTINAGEILREPAVEPPTIVTANSPVELEWVDGNVRLTVRGTATRSGSLGERVTVRTELGKRVEGTVVGPGRIRLD
jgi:flagella basal body P-ring formation protein FlgA